METVRSEYGPDTAHTRTDRRIEREINGQVQTAEHPNISSVEHVSEHESDSGHTDMDLDADDEDETVH